MAADIKSRVEKLAAKLEAAIHIDESGFRGYEGIQFDECFALLKTIITCSKQIPEEEKNRILMEALMAVGAKGTVTNDLITTEVKKLESAFLQRPLEPYVLCTSISVERSMKLKTTKLCDATVSFKKTLPSKFSAGAVKLQKMAEQKLATNPPADYLSVVVYVTARSPFDAANKAFEAFDLLRGIWNFAINRQTLTRTSYGNREPVNQICLGPFHTLHRPSGDLATEMWWYDPDYQKPKDPANLAKHLEVMYQIEKEARRLLSGHKYKDVFEWCIKEYCRALDHWNWSTAYLKLWSVLETLTDSEKSNYTTTIRRAAFLWDDPDYHKEVLNSLRELRNSFVHENKNSSDIETYIYLLKRYVEALIKFHFGRGKFFTNKSHAAQFLDLPTDPDLLQDRIKEHELALKYRA